VRDFAVRHRSTSLLDDVYVLVILLPLHSVEDVCSVLVLVQYVCTIFDLLLFCQLSRTVVVMLDLMQI